MKQHLPRNMKVLKPHILSDRRVVVSFANPNQESMAIEKGSYAAYSLGPTPIVTHKVVPPIMCKSCADYGCTVGTLHGYVLLDRHDCVAVD